MATRTYDPAFSDEEATIVLTSSDDVNYRLHSFTLRTTSGFFRGMISLPQKPSGDDASKVGEDEQIALSEGSKVLGILFRIISGLLVDKWGSLDEVKDILAAAQKYDMPGPISAIRSVVTSPPRLQEQPLQCYAIAARYDWEEEARIISTYTLNKCLHDEGNRYILEQVPSPYLLRLLRLHKSRRDKFKEHIIKGNKCFGIESSHGCTDSCMALLGQFAQILVSEMENHPGGDTLIAGSWKRWPIYGSQIVEDIKVGLNNLPTKIEVPAQVHTPSQVFTDDR
ncbi:hypothetical protein FIBSPDRAFT_1039357 [Athelia psychrophila]|uniref:BTB domain-containing protein n=1 Tax=Athelia psychrophila TaxID=1759441 RepID=A0A166RS23_9AGAM|nr:hypothetical protein FIBSPDRAFT_1039357 [Fibularhizoctonia sp. CBS 109695]